MAEYDEFYITRCRAPGCNEIFKSRQYRLRHERTEHSEQYKGEHGYTVFYGSKQERDKEWGRLSELLSNTRRTEISIMKEEIQKEKEQKIMANAQEQVIKRKQEAEVKPIEQPTVKPVSQPIQPGLSQEIVFKKEEVKIPKSPEEVITEHLVKKEQTAIKQVFDEPRKDLNKEKKSFLDEFNEYFNGDEL